ncbi:hypothetical protein BXZ70DRAFT_1011325 [Cristinia sonorae]|uniref:F-box domain-containing protein n=1 Tax=Cristinia sonorae TaxID=1940300 RepID=A0A8K0XLK5_9AGAR|nr:hypothetical protein BXZ70DRAFT_1011325 [Cristinia sonorae]
MSSARVPFAVLDLSSHPCTTFCSKALAFLPSGACYLRLARTAVTGRGSSGAPFKSSLSPSPIPPVCPPESDSRRCIMKISQWFMRRFLTSSRRDQRRKSLSKAGICNASQVPYDILLYIVAYLYDDLRSIQACNLVSHSWREAALPLLFRNITLSGTKRLLQLEERMEVDPSIRSWVRELHLDRSLEPFGHFPGSGSQCPTWFYQPASKLASKLHNLTTLHFLHVTDMNLLPSPLFFHQLTRFRHVRTLILDDCHFSDPVLYAFVSAFPKLTDFHLRCHHRAPGERQDLHCAYPPSLTSLTVDIAFSPGDTVTPFLEWIANTPSTQSLRSLVVNNVSGILVMMNMVCVAEYVGKLVKRCVGLEHLGLMFIAKNEVMRSEPDDVFASYFDLTQNVRLQSIELKDPAHSSLIPTILQSCVVDLRRVSIFMDTPLPPTCISNHRAIVTLLSSPAYTEMEEVRLVDVAKGYEDVVRQTYEPLMDRGLAKLIAQIPE